jgi:hypothetical protein
VTVLTKFVTVQSRGGSVLMSDRTLVQTETNCPQPGSYMVENPEVSVRTEI